MNDPIHIISLGAGVQSSAMALMAAAGELRPLPACAIFADTQAEPASVYRWLDWLEPQLPFRVYRVTAGDLAETSTRIRTSGSGQVYISHSVPAYTLNKNGSKGTWWRQCTDKHKLVPLRKAINAARGKHEAIVWIGISKDEIIRMKPSRVKGIVHSWPLIDANLTRQGCLDWMRKKGFPTPPRSSCSFCPYHSNAEWRRLKVQEPQAFDEAVAYEQRMQTAAASIPRLDSVPFLHPSRVPLSQVDFCDPKIKQPELWGNECEGMCGV